MDAAGLELEVVHANAQRGPMQRRAAHGLAYPCRRLGEIHGDVGGAGAGPPVGPAQHLGHHVWIVLEVGGIDSGASLKQHDVDAFLAQLVGERSAARARADDDDHRVIVVVVGDRRHLVVEVIGRGPTLASERRRDLSITN